MLVVIFNLQSDSLTRDVDDDDDDDDDDGGEDDVRWTIKALCLWQENKSGFMQRNFYCWLAL